MSTKFQLPIKTKILTKKFLALCLSDVVSIMLINVKMPTIVGFFSFMSEINVYERNKFRTQLRWALKKFYNLGARARTHNFAPAQHRS